MSDFEERKIYQPNTCRHCRHGIEVHLEVSDDYVIKSYCLLGLSREDAAYLENELYSVIEEEPNLSKRACKLLEIKHPDDVLYSPRRTEVTDCCDKFE